MSSPRSPSPVLEDTITLGTDLLFFIIERVLDPSAGRSRGPGARSKPLEAVARPSAPDLRRHHPQAPGKRLASSTGTTFGAPEETLISEMSANPVLITIFPAAIKDFLHAAPTRSAPTWPWAWTSWPRRDYGEVIGGGQRFTIRAPGTEIQEHKLPRDAYQWYIDLRKFGSCPPLRIPPGRGADRFLDVRHQAHPGTIPFRACSKRIYPLSPFARADLAPGHLRLRQEPGRQRGHASAAGREGPPLHGRPAAPMSSCSTPAASSDRRAGSRAAFRLALDIKRKRGARVVVAGCYAERYRPSSPRRHPGSTHWLGVADYDKIADAALGGAFRPGRRTYLYDHRPPGPCRRPPAGLSQGVRGLFPRVFLLRDPLIKGPYRSRPASSILEEARRLAGAGIKEINLISQDTTYYGRATGAAATPWPPCCGAWPKSRTWPGSASSMPTRGISDALLEAMAHPSLPLPGHPLSTCRLPGPPRHEAGHGRPPAPSA